VKLGSNLWLGGAGEAHLGRGRIELLARIEETGSISRAAKAMKMSYKAAWEAVNEMNALSATPIVERATGGKGGGGTVLTERGRELIAIFRRIEEAQEAFFGTLGSYADDWQQLQAFTAKAPVRTSARNQLPATVTAIRETGGHAHVTCALFGDATITAQITLRSLHDLALHAGSRVTILFKPAWVTLHATRPDPAPTNLLNGTICECDGEEIHITLAPDTEIIATSGGTWTAGTPVWLHITPTNMLLAV
jgi:molybdate transport system regulatory protein